MKAATTATYEDFVEWFTARQFQRNPRRLNDACRYFDDVGVERLTHWFERIQNDNEVCVLEHPRFTDGCYVITCSCGWTTGQCAYQPEAENKAGHHVSIR